MQNMNRTIILASQSPRRRELLTQAGFEYQVEPSQMEEVITKEQPWEVVMELSRQKAEDIYDKHMSDKTPILVIGADTVVAYGSKILGKPHSEEEAFEMLNTLQGNSHQVYTGVTLVWNEEDGKHCHTFYEETAVTLYPMAEEEIHQYIRLGDSMNKADNRIWDIEEMVQAGWMDGAGSWKTNNGCRPLCMDKAGSYGIQTQFGVYIKGIQGDYNNVVGLPIARLYQEIKGLQLL